MSFEIESKREGFQHPIGRLERMLKLIVLLKYKRYTKEKLALILNKSVKQTSRDLKSLERFYDMDEDEYGRHFIFSERDENGLLVSLTNEEMAYLANLVGDNQHCLREGLLAKLDKNMHLDIDARTKFGRMVNAIKRAIKNKKQITLDGYQGAKDQLPKTVNVEPIGIWDLKYLVAYDPNDIKSKFYSLDRIHFDILILDEEWKYQDKHDQIVPDVFGWRTGIAERVRIALSNSAGMLLKEEFPRSRQFVNSQHDTKYPFIFDAYITGLQGAARFVMGLLDEVKILEGDKLKKFIDEKLKKGIEQ